MGMGGGDYGTSRCSEGNANRSARPAATCGYRERWHVQDHNGSPRVSCIQSLQELQQLSARAGWGTFAQPAKLASHRAEPGGLAGVIRTIVGGGSVPGSVLTHGVGNTVQDFERSGHGEIARSWVGRGENRPITAEKLEAALGEDGIKDLMQQTGMERDELLATLSEYLPRVIDHLTPEGRLPTKQEASRLA